MNDRLLWDAPLVAFALVLGLVLLRRLTRDEPVPPALVGAVVVALAFAAGRWLVP